MGGWVVGRGWSSRRRTALISVAVVFLVFGLGAAAVGYWRAAGAGTGTATTGTTLSVTLTPGTPTAALYPGGQSDVVLSVSNPNTFAVHIGSFTLDTSQGTGGFAVDGGHAGCAVASLTYTAQTNGGAGWTVPAKVLAVNGTLAVTLTTALAMALSAANACQGATATVYLAAGP